MPLFQQSVQKKFIKDLDKAKVDLAYQKLVAHFGHADVQKNIKTAKEEQYQEGFLRELFVDVLGYTLHPQPNYNLITEQKNEKNSKKADGAILKNTSNGSSNGFKPVAVIELKSVKTADLQSIEIQAFNYKNNQTECVYVVTSNFQKLRFYIENAVDFEEFDLFDLSKERFDLLYLCLHVDNVLSDLPLRIKQASLEREENITKKLYADYSLFKQALFKDITDNNKANGFKPIEIFKKTQKLLDRFLFIFFAEDKGLLPPNSVSEILNQWEKLKELDAYQPLYNRFKLYFGYLNNGHVGKHYTIFAYNGGLFAPDDLLDNFIITDGVLYQHCRALSHYDFDTEVDTNILGHIFEHSLNEVDAVIAQSKGFKPLEVGKRKKDGIFYTPRYITKYIVESTVGELCKQKKLTLELDNEALIKADTKKDRKLYQSKIDDYRNWLLHLTILDPACGSGAFLNQAFEFLLQEHRLIDSMTAMLFGDSLVMTDNVTEILENNIFGVDINEESVEIARLSLWLRTAKVGRKLNDLSRNIKCGNSLISDPSVAGDLAFDWHSAFPKIFRNKNKEGFHVVLTTHNSRTSKRMIAYKVEKGEPLEFNLEDEMAMTKIIRDIILEKSYNCIAYNICKDHVHLILVCEYSELTNIVKTIKGKSAYLFNRWYDGNNGLKPIGVTKSNGFQPIVSNEQSILHVWSQKFFRAFLDNWELAELSKKPGWLYDDTYLDNAISYVQNNRNKHNLPQSDELDAIIASFCKNTEGAYASETTGGFDVVIGNPPYGANISENDKKYYLSSYKYQSYQLDTYLLFYEKSFHLLKPKGLMGFITPNTWLSALFSTKIRELLINSKILKTIVHYDYFVFNDATVDADIYIFENAQPNDDSKLIIAFEHKVISKNYITKIYQNSWIKKNGLPINIYQSNLIEEIISRISIIKLGEISKIVQGTKPYQIGKGKPPQTEDILKNKPFDSDKIINDTFKPLMRGDMMNKYIIFWDNNYFISYGEWLAEPRYSAKFDGNEKLLIRQTGDSIIATYDNRQFIARDNLYVLFIEEFDNLDFNIKYLLSILNSTFTTWYYQNAINPEKGKALAQVKRGHLIEILIPEIDFEQQKPFIELVDKMLTYKADFYKQSTRFIKLFTSMGNPMGLNPLKSAQKSAQKSELKSALELTVNKKLEKWYELTFGEFRKELEKQKIVIPIKELMDYQELFDTNAAQIKELQTKINNTEKAIDKLVYALYDLTDEEIQIIEN